MKRNSPAVSLSTMVLTTPPKHRERGFTLVELLVVIAIIGILSTLAVVGLNSARLKAKEAAAKADLRALATAIDLLATDTGKWPNGCPIEQESNPEVLMNLAAAAIAVAPVVGNQGDGCAWTAEDVANWHGPYAKKVIDPWGMAYYFDPDYEPYANCASIPDESPNPSLVSFGPNKVGPNVYDCDDIYRSLR